MNNNHPTLPILSQMRHYVAPLGLIVLYGPRFPRLRSGVGRRFTWGYDPSPAPLAYHQSSPGLPIQALSAGW